MGIMDKVGNFLGSDTVRNGVREMTVARPVDNSSLIWKRPDQIIPMFAQCMVRADEWAVFVKEGRPVGTLDTGQCTLATANIPFLSNFVDQYISGDLFVADVFFVKRTPYLVPIAEKMGVMLDPLTRVRLHPQCSGMVLVRVVNPERLLLQLHEEYGLKDPHAMLDRISSVVCSAIRSSVLRVASLKQWTVPVVLSDLQDVAADIAQGCEELAQLGLQYIAIPEFKFDLQPQEFESTRLAMEQLQIKQLQSVVGNPTPPLVQQIFEQGVREGELKGKREALLRMINQANIQISDEQRKVLLGCTHMPTLDGWIDSVLVSRTAEEIFRRRA